MPRDRAEPRDERDDEPALADRTRQTRILQIRALHLVPARRAAVPERAAQRRGGGRQSAKARARESERERERERTHKKFPHSPRNVPAATIANPGPRPHTSPHSTAMISWPNSYQNRPCAQKERTISIVVVVVVGGTRGTYGWEGEDEEDPDRDQPPGWETVWARVSRCQRALCTDGHTIGKRGISSSRVWLL